MLPVPSYLAAPLAEGTLSITPEFAWSSGPGQPWNIVPVLSGNYAQSRTSQTRWAASVVVSSDYVTAGPTGVHPYGCRARLRLAITAPGVTSTYYVPAGVYAVTGVTNTRPGSAVAIDCSSFEVDVQESQFVSTRSLPSGVGGYPLTNYGQIESLITEAIPDAEFDWDESLLTPDLANATMANISVSQDRWAIISGPISQVSLANSMGAEVFCNSVGRFRVQPIPQVKDYPDFTLPDSVHVERQDVWDRTGMANVIAVTGNGPGGEVGPAFSWDSNDESLTYAGPDPINKPELAGPFGVKPFIYQSPVVTTLGQAQQAASGYLRDLLGVSFAISGSSTLNPFTEVGDTAQVAGTNYLIDSVSYTFGDATMSYVTRTMNTATVLGL